MDALDAALYLDIYGGLLTGKQAEILDIYYNEDYSLSEVAGALNISRQAAHDAIRGAALALAEYEKKLGLVKAHRDDIAKSAEAGEALAEIRGAAASIRGAAYVGAQGLAALADSIEASAARLEKIIDIEP